MLWIDVFGAPGVGKSTICDALWHPHAIPWQTTNTFPPEWGDFLKECKSLLKKVDGNFGVERSLKKMAAVHAKDDERAYIHTCFAQRGLGFGRRLKDPEEIYRYYKLMPVSLGAVSLCAPAEVLEERNREREFNRAFMLPMMERPREIALETLKKRGVPLLELDTRRSPDDLRKQILGFRDDCMQSVRAFHPPEARSGGKISTVSPPA